MEKVAPSAGQSHLTPTPTAETRRRTDNAEKTEKAERSSTKLPVFLPFSVNPLCLCASVVGVEFQNAMALAPSGVELSGCVGIVESPDER